MIDDAIERSLALTEELLRDHGGTEEEIADECARTRATCIASRDAYLQQLRRQL